MSKVFDEFILANTMLNLGGLVHQNDAPPPRAIPDDSNGDNKPQRNGWLNTHVTHGVRHGDVVPLRRIKNFTATVFDCDHTVPCVGYVFSISSRPLKQQYRSLPGHEIKALRLSGAEITTEQSTPIFAFLGDTTAATLAADPEWLRNGIPVVITECSFLYEEHRVQADRTKHTIWSDLEKVIRKWPATTFVITHFSLRYSDEEVNRFFTEMDDPPGNIVVWADGGDI
ncbi:beta-lactamase-like protein [Dactylonectria estremocensis]|uniref:Beta-lactamase-like protein n=1 Tax=Dactylonectria estremocensis TaxID=1079267 RepID=A0A9P9E0W6_9HYPO|nr:beta-lactamase-like protein [Dactylonectria estremocensis]